mgnify:CR=1 FL=1
MKILAWLVLALAILPGCSNHKQKNENKAVNPMEPPPPSGLKLVELVPGQGPSPKTGQKVTVHYTGTFQDGKKFDSSVDRGQPFSFTLGVGQVIKGWDEGVATMKVGEKRKLLIPSQLGYGASGAGGIIPPNTDLIFEVELLTIQ